MSKTCTQLIQEAIVWRTPQLSSQDNEGVTCYLLLLSPIPCGILIGRAERVLVSASMVSAVTFAAEVTIACCCGRTIAPRPDQECEEAHTRNYLIRRAR